MSAAAAGTTRRPVFIPPPGKTSMLLSRQQPTPPNAAAGVRINYPIAENMVFGFLVVFLLCRVLFDLPFSLVVSGTVPFLVLLKAQS